MPTLFLRLLTPAHRDDEGYHLSAAWRIVEDDGATRAEGETDYRGLSDLIDPSADWLADPENIVAFLPTRCVLALTCDVPGRSTGQIKRALPFVVEEFVASDIESLHLAAGSVQRGQPVAVNALDRVSLENWLECLASLEIRPGYLLAESELIPVEQGASVVVDDTTTIVRTGTQAAEIDRDNLLLTLSGLEIESLRVDHGQLTDLELGQLDPAIAVDQNSNPADSLFGYLVGRFRSDGCDLNLLQGDYVPKRPQSRSQGQWQAVAGLAAVWVVVALIGLVTQGFWASVQADNLEDRSAELYRDIYPGEQRITNVRRQMSQKLGARVDGGGSGFTTYLGHLAQGIDRNASILSLNYTDARNELAADLLLKNYDELERMKQRLGQLGISVEITSAEQQDTGVRARIRLKEG